MEFTSDVIHDTLGNNPTSFTSLVSVWDDGEQLCFPLLRIYTFSCRLCYFIEHKMAAVNNMAKSCKYHRVALLSRHSARNCPGRKVKLYCIVKVSFRKCKVLYLAHTCKDLKFHILWWFDTSVSSNFMFLELPGWQRRSSKLLSSSCRFSGSNPTWTEDLSVCSLNVFLSALDLSKKNVFLPPKHACKSRKTCMFRLIWNYKLSQGLSVNGVCVSLCVPLFSAFYENTTRLCMTQIHGPHFLPTSVTIGSSWLHPTTQLPWPSHLSPCSWPPLSHLSQQRPSGFQVNPV